MKKRKGLICHFQRGLLLVFFCLLFFFKNYFIHSRNFSRIYFEKSIYIFCFSVRWIVLRNFGFSTTSCIYCNFHGICATSSWNVIRSNQQFNFYFLDSDDMGDQFCFLFLAWPTSELKLCVSSINNSASCILLLILWWSWYNIFPRDCSLHFNNYSLVFLEKLVLM